MQTLTARVAADDMLGRSMVRGLSTPRICRTRGVGDRGITLTSSAIFST